jgi:hypothetical protein
MSISKPWSCPRQRSDEDDDKMAKPHCHPNGCPNRNNRRVGQIGIPFGSLVTGYGTPYQHFNAVFHISYLCVGGGDQHLLPPILQHTCKWSLFMTWHYWNWNVYVDYCSNGTLCAWQPGIPLVSSWTVSYTFVKQHNETWQVLPQYMITTLFIQ